MPARIVSNPPDPMETDDDHPSPPAAAAVAVATAGDSAAATATPPPAPPPASAVKNASTAAATNGSETDRRRSTRVVKQSLRYSQEAPPPPPPTTKAKRKRPVREEAEEEEDQEEEGEQGDASGTDKNEHGNDGDNDDDDGDDDDDEESSSEEEDSDEGEPDEEEEKERRRKSTASKKGRGRGRPPSGIEKPPVKKTKMASGVAAPVRRVPMAKNTNGRARSVGRGKPKSKGKEKEANGDQEGPEEQDLYERIFESDDDHKNIANEWVVKYEQDNAEAMKEIVNFILKCCGCDKNVTSYDIEDQDSAAATLSQIQEEFQKQQNTDYPLTSKKPEFRRFRQTLSSFLQSLIYTISARSLLYTDPALIENIQVWITAMSSSTLRQFRHTATAVALDIVSHLCTIAAEARKSNSNTNRQIEGESQKKNKRNEGRIAALEEKLREGEERKDTVESIIKDIFDTVFVHRYRDIDFKIRSDCVRELGSWILSLPDVFFDGSYLRYLGWVLSDTTPATRHEVIKALTKLFKKKDSVSGLRHFTERFRPRLVEMATRDADSSVRAATVELLDVVREVGYLEPQDVDTVGRLLFDAEPKVRRAVVGFFVENIGDLYEAKIEELGGEEAVIEGLGGDVDNEGYEGVTLGWIKLKCLVEVLSSYDSEDAEDDENGISQGVIEKTPGVLLKGGDAESRFSLAGTVLWEAFEGVRDWEGLARYLLYDHSASIAPEGEESQEDIEMKVKATVALGAKEDVILLHVLNASVAASILEGAEGPASKKKGAPKRTVKEIEKHRETVSRNLMQLIPPLLKKFGPVPDAASTVLRLEQLMKLDVFQELRQSNAYASLLDDISRQFLTHADESVLKEASAALLHAKSFEELDEVTDMKVGQLKDETVTMLIDAVRGKDLGSGRFSDASLTELINTVRRLEYLSSITDCVEMMETPPVAASASSAEKGAEIKPVGVLMELLKRGGSVDELEEELIVRTMKTLVYYFMWKIKSLNEDENEISDQDVEDLVTRRECIFSRVGDILHKRKTVDTVNIAAAGCILELSTLFMSAGARSGGEARERLKTLGKPISNELQTELLKLFESLEKTFAKATRRPLEPDENAEPEEDEEDEDEDEDIEESTLLMHEQRLCEYTGKIVLAVLSSVVDETRFRDRVGRNKTKLGPNFKELLSHLEEADQPKRRPGRPGRKPKPDAAGDGGGDGGGGEKMAVDENLESGHEDVAEEGHEEQQHAEEEEDEEEEMEHEGGEQEQEEHHQHEEEEEEDDDEEREQDKQDKQGGGDDEGNESEPDPEVEVPKEDEDLEMPDA